MITLAAIFLIIYGYKKTKDEIFLMIGLLVVIITGIADYQCIIEVIKMLKG